MKNEGEGTNNGCPSENGVCAALAYESVHFVRVNFPKVNSLLMDYEMETLCWSQGAFSRHVIVSKLSINWLLQVYGHGAGPDSVQLSESWLQLQIRFNFYLLYDLKFCKKKVV